MQLFGLRSQMGFVAMLIARFHFACIAVHRALLPSVTSHIVFYLAGKCQCVTSVLRIKSFVVRTTVL